VSHLSIRPAKLSDAVAIADIHVETWKSAYAGILPTAYLGKLDRTERLRFWQNLLSDVDTCRHVSIAEVNAVPIGFLSHGLARDPQFQDWREIYAFYVAPDFQGIGAGTALLKQALSQIQNRGDMGAYLWVIAANPARYFYEAQNGHLLSERTEPIAQQNHRMLAYGWQVEPDI